MNTNPPSQPSNNFGYYQPQNPQNTPQQPWQMPMPPVPPDNPKKGRGLILMMIIILLLVGVVGYGAYAYMNDVWPATLLTKNANENTNKTKNTNNSTTNKNGNTNSRSKLLPGTDKDNTNTANTNQPANGSGDEPEEPEPTTLEPANTGTQPVAEDKKLTNEEIDSISAIYKDSSKVSSIKYKYSLSLDAKGLSRTKLSMDGKGAIEQEEFLYPDAETTMNYDVNANGVTAQGGVASKSVGGTVYVKINGMKTNVDAINTFLTAAQSSGASINNKWVAINYENLAAYYQDDELPDVSYAKTAVNEYWVLYSSIGAMQNAEYVGQETIRGIETDHYKATISQEDMQKAIDQAKKVVYDPVMIMMMELMEYVVANTQDIPVDVWVGHDNLIYKLTTKVVYYDPSAGNDMELNLAFDSLGYNQEITITPPSPTITGTEAMGKMYSLMNMLLGSYTGDPASLQAVIQLFL